MAAFIGNLGSELGGYGLLAAAVDLGLTLGLIVAAVAIGIQLSHHPQDRTVGKLRTAVVQAEKTPGRRVSRESATRELPRRHVQERT